ncbi:MAG TPA: pilus assembly protein PilF [Polaromonas sp.]|uniref:pilus assembly protein PilF n=1 Tax=Polaromonas sp. TaxID=1869339 RepID=UPI002D40FAF5|nr:pilus assembly protein PilF [Polaromonas sp.]HYW56928.1 pilus assembly protein PilF [Polaromonas sp.]
MRTPYLTGLAAFLLGALATALYWPGLQGGFFFDDGPSILLADGVRLQNLSLESLQQAWTSGGAGPTGRPVAQLSFALNHYFSGFSPFAFKTTNLVIHLACAALVFSLALRLLTQNGTQCKPQQLVFASGAVAALWLLHPIQLLPVLHVVQRMTSLSALFLLAALLLHLRGRERGGRAGAAWLMLAWGILWPLSFFSKETGALFPAFALAWELIVRRSSTGGLDRFARRFAVLAGLGLAGTLAYLLSPRAQWLWSGFELRQFTLLERMLTEGRVLWFYLGLLLAPRLEALGLYHDDIAPSTGLFLPWTTMTAWVGLAVLVWLAWRLRRGAPLVAFGIAWFLMGHALESSFLPLELAHEHRNYLPLFGILVAGGSVLLTALGHKGTTKTIPVALTAAALVYFPFVTALRAHQFGDELRRTQIEAQHHRSSARAQYEAGLNLARLADAASPNSPTHAFARQHYELANSLDPAFKMGGLALIDLNCQAGLPVEHAELAELSRRLRETPFAPGDRGVLYGLKEMAIANSICLARPEIDGLFAAALANPGVTSGVQAMLHSWHADYLWLHAGDLPAARAALGRSLTLNPANPSNRLKWAQLLVVAGERAQARLLLLELRDLNFSADERKTLNELLATI